MKILVVLLLVALCAASTTRKTRQILLTQGTSGLFRVTDSSFCDEYKDVTFDYRTSTYDFLLPLYKKMAERSNLNFVISPLSIWTSLAALAEGAEPVAQQKLFQFLRLPNDACTRQKYYDIMNQLIVPGGDIIITNKRTLVFDEDLNINQNWLITVSKYSLLDVSSSPIRRHPLIAASQMSQIMSAPLRSLNLNGNSVILDSIEYNALWTTAFDDAVVQRAPFYDQVGQKIGSVDLMTMKKKVKMVYVPIMDMKVLELPVGINSRYRVLIGVILTKDNNLLSLVNKMTTPFLIEMLDNLKESEIPIDIALPRLTLTSDTDVRSILEDLGLLNLWIDPEATRLVSEPSALPSSYVQRATVSFNKHGISPTLQVQEASYNASTGLDPILGRDFIANKPFLFSIMDSKTYTTIITAAYTQPTYSY